MRGTLPLEQYVEGVVSGDRATLGRAITLIESTRDDHQELAQQVLEAVLPRTGGSWRVGISGVPGAGKSTFIERLGRKLTASGHRVAVLAVDPSSSVSRGSILGDKTRMNELARDPNAFIRPSPSSGTLGGVAARTRETLLLCEAAGFDVVLVETVGVGQSETMVADMVDFFLVLLVAGAGDDLQGIKRGIVELADLIAINKADGQNVLPANRARKHYELALAHLTPVWSGWKPPVVTCSAVEGTGVDELWDQVTDHRQKLEESGELGRKRRRQARKWMWTLVEHLLMQRLHASDDVKRRIEELEARVANGETTAGLAAAEVLRVVTET